MLAGIVASALVLGGRPAGARLESKAGWTCVHLSGAPRQIGFEYGSELSSRIDDAQRALHDELKHETGKSWDYFRQTARKLFWEKLDPEYQGEIEGQAEGLESKGLSYDQWDVLAMNSYIELAENYVPWTKHHPSDKLACSAFVATGSETADGKIVMGQNFWWDFQMGERFNVILDIQPEKGHRILMDTLPGFIHSGTDFAVNDDGIMVTETTLPATEDFDPTGVPEFERMRKAIQYSNNLADFVRIMKDRNNGGYANTWLLADRKNNQIGKLELGLKHVTFQSKTNGFFVGSNFPENPELITDELAGWDPDPSTNGCEARKVRWNTLLMNDKGTVTAELAKGYLADIINPITGASGASEFTLCGRNDSEGANNAKAITSDMAEKMTFWARMGSPDGATIRFPHAASSFLHELDPNPWVIVGR